jgi:hypothetical protein
VITCRAILDVHKDLTQFVAQVLAAGRPQRNASKEKQRPEMLGNAEARLR